MGLRLWRLSLGKHRLRLKGTHERSTIVQHDKILHWTFLAPRAFNDHNGPNTSLSHERLSYNTRVTLLTFSLWLAPFYMGLPGRGDGLPEMGRYRKSVFVSSVFLQAKRPKPHRFKCMNYAHKNRNCYASLIYY